MLGGLSGITLYRPTLLVIQRKNMKLTLRQIQLQTIALRRIRKEMEEDLIRIGMEENE